MAERAAHALVASWLAGLGLRVWEDTVGNLLAERAGTEDLPAIGIGSHLDSVPSGGRFDGIVGVVAAVELIRQLQMEDARTRHPIRVVAFACEEGARFGQACIGSRFAVGSIDRTELDLLRDADGTSLREAATNVGLDIDRFEAARWEASDWLGFLELHVEQGRVLERSRTRIGLVDVVSGSTRVEVTFTGREDHSGGTPMDDRQDALAAAAEFILIAEALAKEPDTERRITVGRIETRPNSLTTIPGQVRLVADIRATEAAGQQRAVRELLARGRLAARSRGVHVRSRRIGHVAPTRLSPWLRDVVAAACGDLGEDHLSLVSGASHDTQVIATIMPGSIVFVPSRDGLSHGPREWTSAADIAAGVRVLMQTIMRLDGA